MRSTCAAPAASTSSTTSATTRATRSARTSASSSTVTEYYEVHGGWSRGLQGRWVRRWTAGATYDRDRFEPDPDEPLGGPLPADRELVYPWVGFELVEDGFQERVNQDQILPHRGRAGRAARLGAARLRGRGAGLGPQCPDRERLRAGRRRPRRAAVRVRVDVGVGPARERRARQRRARRRGALLPGHLRRSKFYAAVSGAVTEQLDTELQLLLGGDNGLRGYPLRYQAGTARALFTRRAALLHQLVSVPAVPRRRRRLLRHGPHLGDAT